jgi:hypothetical protein
VILEQLVLQVVQELQAILALQALLELLVLQALLGIPATKIKTRDIVIRTNHDTA